jgi:hypothetical protein
MIPRLALLAAALALAPLAAEAQSYRCVGKDGKKYYGSTIPPQCVGQPIEQLNAQGTVIRRIQPQATAAEREAKEIEEKKKREEAAEAKERGRRNRALLATYSSEKDIEDARARALADNQKAAKEIEARIEAIRKRQAGYDKELEFYKGKGKPPAKLAEDIQTAQMETKAQEGLLEAKKKEVEAINARYDEDKRRFVDLTKRK